MEGNRSGLGERECGGRIRKSGGGKIAVMGERRMKENKNISVGRIYIHILLYVKNKILSDKQTKNIQFRIGETA